MSVSTPLLMSPFVDWRLPCDRIFTTDLQCFRHINEACWESSEKAKFEALFYTSNPLHNGTFSSKAGMIKGDEAAVNAMQGLCDKVYRLYLLLMSGEVTQFSFATFEKKVQAEYELPNGKRITFFIVRSLKDNRNEPDDRLDYVNRIKPLLERLFANLRLRFDKSEGEKEIKLRYSPKKKTIRIEVYKLKNELVTAPIPEASTPAESVPKSS
jgi:hypothetical protein